MAQKNSGVRRAKSVDIYPVDENHPHAPINIGSGEGMFLSALVHDKKRGKVRLVTRDGTSVHVVEMEHLHRLYVHLGTILRFE